MAETEDPSPLGTSMILQPRPPGCEDMQDDSMVMQQHEVLLVPQPPDPEQLHPMSPLLQEGEAQPTGQWIQHCVELPGQAGRWVQEVFPMHHNGVQHASGGRQCSSARDCGGTQTGHT